MLLTKIKGEAALPVFAGICSTTNNREVIKLPKAHSSGLKPVRELLTLHIYVIKRTIRNSKVSQVIIKHSE